MKRNRLLKAGLAVLVVTIVVAAGLWFLFVATPPTTESDLNATTPEPTVSTAPPEFTMTAAVTARSMEEPSDTTNWSAGVMYDADAEERLGWLNSTDADGKVSMGQFDLLPRLKTRESRHGISGRARPCGFKTHTFQASPAGFQHRLGCLVARSNAPHPQPSHRRSRVLWNDSLR